MGMYDIVKVKIELPDYSGPMDDFQTKSLSSRLDEYTINENGRLIHHTTEWVIVPENEKKHEFHLFNVEPTGDEDENYHGYINFYTIFELEGMIDFEAKFTDGRLVEIQNQKTGTIKRYDDLDNNRKESASGT